MNQLQETLFGRWFDSFVHRYGELGWQHQPEGQTLAQAFQAGWNSALETTAECSVAGFTEPMEVNANECH